VLVHELTRINQFPKLTPRTFSPVEKAGLFDPGSVYQTKLDASDGVAAIKAATVGIRAVQNMAIPLLLRGESVDLMVGVSLWRKRRH
jgi:hypothetical protein